MSETERSDSRIVVRYRRLQGEAEEAGLDLGLGEKLFVIGETRQKVLLATASLDEVSGFLDGWNAREEKDA